MAALPPQLTYPMCTVRETPRIPEHCIQFSYVISWDEFFGATLKDGTVNPNAKKLDKDDPDHMKWICEKAQERADIYKI